MFRFFINQEYHMKIAVTAFPRSKQGTSASRRLRNTGKVPGIIYGAGQAAQQVEFDQAEMIGRGRLLRLVAQDDQRRRLRAALRDAQ